MKYFLILILCSFLTGCMKESTERSRDEVVDEGGANQEGWPEQQEAEMTKFSKAVALLQPSQGNNVSGTVTFTREDNGIRIMAEVNGLKPGKHGFHIHRFGDCTAKDFSSAGDHFNPAGRSHGAPTDAERHAGDFGNIEADQSGNVKFEWTDESISFHGSNSIIGRAVVIHENPDDLTSQPSGNAGGRIACGIIGIAKQ